MSNFFDQAQTIPDKYSLKAGPPDGLEGLIFQLGIENYKLFLTYMALSIVWYIWWEGLRLFNNMIAVGMSLKPSLKLLEKAYVISGRWETVFYMVVFAVLPGMIFWSYGFWIGTIYFLGFLICGSIFSFFYRFAPAEFRLMMGGFGFFVVIIGYVLFVAYHASG